MAQHSLKSKNIHRYILYYLIALVVMNLTYPISAYGSAAAIGYQLFITSTFIFGIFMVGDNRLLFRIALSAAILATISGIYYNLHGLGEQQEITGGLNLLIVSVFFGCFIIFQAILVYALLRYMFSAQHVRKDVLYSAIAVYFLIATTFVPAYRLLEIFNPHSFAVSYGDKTIVEWQNFVYYSYVTMTTVGYGDIVPVNLWAKAIASMEAVIGVLYIAILVSRLVSLYRHDLDEEEKVIR